MDILIKLVGGIGGFRCCFRLFDLFWRTWSVSVFCIYHRFVSIFHRFTIDIYLWPLWRFVFAVKCRR